MRTREDFLVMDEGELKAARADILAQKQENADILAWMETSPGKRELAQLDKGYAQIRDEYGQILDNMAPDALAEGVVRKLLAVRGREVGCASRKAAMEGGKKLEKSLDIELEICNDVYVMRQEDVSTSR